MSTQDSEKGWRTYREGGRRYYSRVAIEGGVGEKAEVKATVFSETVISDHPLSEDEMQQKIPDWNKHAQALKSEKEKFQILADAQNGDNKLLDIATGLARGVLSANSDRHEEQRERDRIAGEFYEKMIQKNPELENSMSSAALAISRDPQVIADQARQKNERDFDIGTPGTIEKRIARYKKEKN